MTNLKFGDYTFRFNPRKLLVKYLNSVSTVSCAGFGAASQLVGPALTVVEAEGELFGSDAMLQFEALRNVFLLRKSQVLSGAGIEPFQAVFHSLSLVGNGGSDVVTYQVRFLEERTI